MRLCEMSENRTAVIHSLKASPETAHHLRDRGFCEGEEVICVKKGVFASPVLYCVKGAQMALRTRDAALIEVTACEES